MFVLNRKYIKEKNVSVMTQNAMQLFSNSVHGDTQAVKHNDTSLHLTLSDLLPLQVIDLTLTFGL